MKETQKRPPGGVAKQLSALLHSQTCNIFCKCTIPLSLNCKSTPLRSIRTAHTESDPQSFMQTCLWKEQVLVVKKHLLRRRRTIHLQKAKALPLHQFDHIPCSILAHFKGKGLLHSLTKVNVGRGSFLVVMKNLQCMIH